MNHAQQERMDKLGIMLSLSCCVHCLATPFLLMAAPALGEYFQSVLVHVLLFVLVAPVALVSFVKTYRHTQKIRPLILGVVGLSGLFIAMLLHVFVDTGAIGSHTHELEVSINIISGLILVCGHFFNFKDSLCKSC